MSNKKINLMNCPVENFFQYYEFEPEQKKNVDREKCSCCGKTCYSYSEAMHMIKTIQKGKFKRAHNKIFLRPYKCNGSWHLTSYHTEKGKRKLQYCA